MALLNRYKYILLGVILVVLLILLRNSGSGFRYDAMRLAGPSVKKVNMVTSQSISFLKSDQLLVILSPGQKPDIQFRGRTISVSADALFSGDNIKEIRKNKGPVILYSPDYSISSRVWMTLAQTGVKNLYIYLTDPDNEVLKK
jgi:hypothetical protein